MHDCKTQPLLTIICMCFNHEQYIEQTLTSFINQKTSFPFEVIVHDDCSTDKSASIIKKISKKYPSIIIPLFENENQYSKGNKIFRIVEPFVKGKYIALCEGDDYWSDCSKLEKQLSFLVSHPDYIACMHATSRYNCLLKKNDIIIGLKSENDCDYTLLNALNNQCHTSSVVCRRELYFDRTNPIFGVCKGIGDYPMKLNMVKKGKVRYIAKDMSVYRYLSCETSYSAKLNANSSDPILGDLKLKINASRELLNQYKNKSERKIIKKFLKHTYFDIVRRTKKIGALKSKSYIFFFLIFPFYKFVAKIRHLVLSLFMREK